MAEHSAETDRVWQEFHSVVNMSGEELREWLLTDAAGEEGLSSDPGHPVSDRGEEVVAILGKRKTDVTGSDVELMNEVAEFVRNELADPQREDQEWRRRLMSVGHDPLAPSSPAPDEEIS